MLELALDLNGVRRAEIRFTDRREGNFADDLPHLRRTVAEGAWTRLRQQHGSQVVVVESPGDAADAAADSAVTAAPGAILSVRTADCAPVALVAREGVVAAVHAGWRGLAGGVIEAAAAAVRRLGGADLSAFVGPCIHAECATSSAASLWRIWPAAWDRW